MKYYPFKEKVTDIKGNKVYRECLFVNLKTFQIQDRPDNFIGDPTNLVITDDDIPEGCIVVDVLMAPIVLELNKKGYRTIYSCQGHLDKDISMGDGVTKDNCANSTHFTVGKYIVNTYVIFEAPQPERYMENLINLPQQFKVKIESVGFPDFRTEGIQNIYGVKRYKEYNNKRISIHSLMPHIVDSELDYNKLDQEVFDKYANVNRIMLASWVAGLPDLTKEPIEKSNALYDERIIDKDTARQFGFEFDSIQDFASDIKQCHEVMVESIDTINHEMTMLNDMMESISIRLSNLGIVDDIRNE